MKIVAVQSSCTRPALIDGRVSAVDRPPSIVLANRGIYSTREFMILSNVVMSMEIGKYVEALCPADTLTGPHHWTWGTPT